jgi:hypothetical protein
LWSCSSCSSSWLSSAADASRVAEGGRAYIRRWPRRVRSVAAAVVGAAGRAAGAWPAGGTATDDAPTQERPQGDAASGRRGLGRKRTRSRSARSSVLVLAVWADAALVHWWYGHVTRGVGCLSRSAASPWAEPAPCSLRRRDRSLGYRPVAARSGRHQRVSESAQDPRLPPGAANLDSSSLSTADWRSGLRRPRRAQRRLPRADQRPRRGSVVVRGIGDARDDGRLPSQPAYLAYARVARRSWRIA